VKRRRHGGKRLVEKDEIKDEILKLLGDRWIMERDVIKFIAKLYESKISVMTARNYVLEFEERDEIRVGQAEAPDGRIVRALKLS